MAALVVSHTSRKTISRFNPGILEELLLLLKNELSYVFSVGDLYSLRGIIDNFVVLSKNEIVALKAPLSRVALVMCPL